MMTNPIATPSTTAAKAATDITTSPATQKVVIVNGNTDVMALVETVLDAGRYDIVFVESNEHAYSHIKRVQPHLVILCMRIEDHEGFQVLSMLKLDDETRRIPVSPIPPSTKVRKPTTRLSTRRRWRCLPPRHGRCR